MLKSINLRLNSLKIAKEIYFQRDNNAKPHIKLNNAKIVKEKIAKFGSNPPYSADFASFISLLEQSFKGQKIRKQREPTKRLSRMFRFTVPGILR